MRASLLPTNAAGKPTPISAAIDPPIGESREQANKIREVTGAVKIVLLVIAVAAADRLAAAGREHDPALDLRPPP